MTQLKTDKDALETILKSLKDAGAPDLPERVGLVDYIHDALQAHAFEQKITEALSIKLDYKRRVNLFEEERRLERNRMIRKFRKALK